VIPITPDRPKITLRPIEPSTSRSCHQISRLVPTATILFLSQNNDVDLVAMALSNGAKGYVLKLDATRELLPAVDAVLRGERFASSSLTQDH